MEQRDRLANLTGRQNRPPKEVTLAVQRHRACRGRLGCPKNKFAAAPGIVPEVEVRYVFGATLFTAEHCQGTERGIGEQGSGAAALAGRVCGGLIPHQSY